VARRVRPRQRSVRLRQAVARRRVAPRLPLTLRARAAMMHAAQRHRSGRCSERSGP
jgi:hypothetical protein